MGASFAHSSLHDGVSGPTSFGTGDRSIATGTSGDAFAIGGYREGIRLATDGGAASLFGTIREIGD